MPTIPGFPVALDYLHQAWHDPLLHPGMPTRIHLPPAAGSGLEFLQFHRDFLNQFRTWFQSQNLAKQLDVTPWTSIPSELKSPNGLWPIIWARQEKRIITNSPPFATHDEFGLYIETAGGLDLDAGLHRYLHFVSASYFKEPIVDTVQSPQSTLFYKIHGLIDYWWNQWRKFDCIAVTGSYLYATERGALTRIDPSSGNRQILGNGDEWAGSTCMAASGGYIYIVQGRYLVRAEPATGAWKVIGQDDWTGSTCAATYGDYIYLVQDRFLLRVTPTTGAWQILGTGDWTGSTCMTVLGNQLYIIQGRYLVRADPVTGAWKVIGTRNWSGSSCMAAYGGSLYVVQGSTLVRANPTTGTSQLLGAGNEWAGATSMVPFGDRLYITQGPYVVRTVPADGSWQII